MDDNIKYTVGEIGGVRVVKDFLPSPANLVPRPRQDVDGRDKPGHDDGED